VDVLQATSHYVCKAKVAEFGPHRSTGAPTVGRLLGVGGQHVSSLSELADQ
jgi:hypothetical protein